MRRGGFETRPYSFRPYPRLTAVREEVFHRPEQKHPEPQGHDSVRQEFPQGIREVRLPAPAQAIADDESPHDAHPNKGFLEKSVHPAAQ